jgi:hypothetical protein
MTFTITCIPKLASVSKPPRTRHNTSPKHKGQKQGGNAITYLEANKTHSTTQHQEQPQRNTSIEVTHPDKT